MYAAGEKAVLTNQTNGTLQLEGAHVRDTHGRSQSHPFGAVAIPPHGEVVLWTAPGGRFKPAGVETDNDGYSAGGRQHIFWRNQNGSLRKQPGLTRVGVMRVGVVSVC